MKKLFLLSLLAVPALQANEEAPKGNFASQLVDKMISPLPDAFHFPARSIIGLGAGYGIYELVNYLAPDKIDVIIEKMLIAVPGEDLREIINNNKAHFCALGIAAYTYGMTLEAFGKVLSVAGTASLLNVTRNRMRGHRAYRSSNNEYLRMVYELAILAGPQILEYAPQLVAMFRTNNK